MKSLKRGIVLAAISIIGCLWFMGWAWLYQISKQIEGEFITMSVFLALHFYFALKLRLFDEEGEK